MDGIVIRKWEGLPHKISPLGIEFELREGTLFNILYKYYEFDNILEDSKEVKVHPEDAPYENEVKRIEELKKLLAGGQVKITIRIEVENNVR